MSKYDWITLEREFVTHIKYRGTSLREYAKLKGIPYNAHYSKKTSGWTEKKRAKQEQNSCKIESKIEEEELSREVATVERHYKIWNKLLDIVERSLESSKNIHSMRGLDAPYKAFKGIAEIMDKASKGQRLALGLKDVVDKEKEKEETVQININIEDCRENGK